MILNFFACHPFKSSSCTRKGIHFIPFIAHDKNFFIFSLFLSSSLSSEIFFRLHCLRLLLNVFRLFLSYFPLLKIILMKTVFSCCIVRCFVCCIIFSFEWIEIQRWKERESQCFSRWSCEFVSMNISRLRISWTHSREGEERVAFLLRIQMMFVQSGTKNVKQYTEREREKKRKNTIEYYSTLSVDPGIQAPWRVVYL